MKVSAALCFALVAVWGAAEAGVVPYVTNPPYGTDAPSYEPSTVPPTYAPDCSNAYCPELTCPESQKYTLAGECCQRCGGCEVDSVWYAAGDFKTPSCSSCKCTTTGNSWAWSCSDCTGYATQPPTYPTNAPSYEPSTAPPTYAPALDCANDYCPEVTCPESYRYRPAGQCCQRCGCQVDSVWYAAGNFRTSTCSSCRCDVTEYSQGWSCSDCTGNYS